MSEGLSWLTDCISVEYWALFHYWAKHPAKVHIWAGISLKRSTGWMPRLTSTSWIKHFFHLWGMYSREDTVDTCRTMTPSIPLAVPKNISCHRVFTGGKHLHGGRIVTLQKTCGMNSEFLRREVKPQTEDELVQGILKFWDTVDIANTFNTLEKFYPVLLNSMEMPQGIRFTNLSLFVMLILRITLLVDQ